MKTAFETPELLLFTFDAMDVMVTSGEGDGIIEEGEGNDG